MLLRDLLPHLACPCDKHGSLTLDNLELVATCCGRRFPVVDGIPVLLLSEAIDGEVTPRA